MDENSILVQIKGDTAQLNAALEKANADLKKFGKTTNDVSKYVNSWTVNAAKYSMILHGIKNAWGMISGVMRSLLSSFVEFGTVLDTVSKQTNISATNLSRLKYAAEQSGVQFEVMADALKTFQEQLGAARFGDAGAIGKLSAVGIDPQSFDGLSEQDQFLKLADHISRITDPAKQARTAIELFGDAGYQLLPFFQQGKDGIEALCKEADRLGFTFTEKDAKSAAELKKNIEALKSTFISVGQQIMELLAEPLTKALEWCRSAIQWITKFLDQNPSVIYGIKGVAMAIAAVGTALAAVSIMASLSTPLGIAATMAVATAEGLGLIIKELYKMEDLKSQSDALDAALASDDSHQRALQNDAEWKAIDQGIAEMDSWKASDDAKERERTLEEEERSLSEHQKKMRALDEEEKQLEEEKMRRQTKLNEMRGNLHSRLAAGAEFDEIQPKLEKVFAEEERLKQWHSENLAKIETKRLAEETAEIERQNAEAAEKAAEAAKKEEERQKKILETKEKILKLQKELNEETDGKLVSEFNELKEKGKELLNEVASLGNMEAWGEAFDEYQRRLDSFLRKTANATNFEVDPNSKDNKITKLEASLANAKISGSAEVVASAQAELDKAVEENRKWNLDMAQGAMEAAAERSRQSYNAWMLRKDSNISPEEKLQLQDTARADRADYEEKVRIFSALADDDYQKRLEAARPPELSSRGTFSAFGLDSVLGADVQKEQLDNLKKICSAVLGLYEKAQGETVLKPAH